MCQVVQKYIQIISVLNTWKKKKLTGEKYQQKESTLIFRVYSMMTEIQIFYLNE